MSSSLVPSPEQLARFTKAPERPFVMINLLAFKKDVADAVERYRRYMVRTQPLLADIGGEVLWYGSASESFIGPAVEDWDEVLLVRYPSRAALVRMINDPRYAEIHHDRQAALASTRLIVSEAP